MPITALPTPPSRSDTVNFASRGDSFLGALPNFVTEANALETNVNNKEASATTSANTATTKAGEALTSANNAATSKTGADTARDAAVVARTAAEAALDSFDDRYLGPKATAPTLDNDGAALLTGALYWDTALPGMRSWNGTAWVTLPAATAAAIANTPAAGVTELEVQGAINGLEARKAALAGSITQAFNASTVNGAPLLHHNDIINGDFRIAQAGTSFAAPAYGAYDFDGWLNNANVAVVTVDRVAGSVAGSDARRVTVTTAKATVAAGDFFLDETRIEGYNIVKYVGNTFTIGFKAWVPVVGIHCVALRNVGNDRSYIKEINFPTANVWQDCSFTVVGGLPTTGTWNYTNGVGLAVSFAHTVGATYQTTPDAWNTGNFFSTANQVNDCAALGKWQIEKFTMNLGTVAAVNEIDVGAELARCQRQHRIITVSVRAVATAASQTFETGYQHAPMRAIPTVGAAISSLSTNTSSISLQSVTEHGGRFQIVSAAAGETYAVAHVVPLSARL